MRRSGWSGRPNEQAHKGPFAEPAEFRAVGWAVFVSTPKGHNWFYDLYSRGLDPSETDYASFTFPSNASPYFPAREWAEAQRTLPGDVFRQEYMADFLEDSAGGFRNIDGCLIEPRMDANGREADSVRSVVIGCDVAKHTDWTVLVAMDAESGRCFAMERFNHLDWPIQKERIVSFARRYRGRVIMDATGIGDPIYDDLKRVLPDIEGFKLTPGSKTELIQRLIVAVEQRKVSWPGERRFEQKATEGTERSGREKAQEAQKDWDVLTSEMRRYEYEIGPSEGISYSAPSGYHDDCVMALAPANHRRWETETCGRMLPVGVSGRRRVVAARRRERVVVG